MGKSKQITPRKRAIIAQYMKDGLKQRDICDRMNMNKTTVSKLLKKLRETGSVEAKKPPGRPRVTSRKDDASIRRSAVRHPTFSSLQIKVDSNVSASCRTVRRRLQLEFGLRAHRPAKKPLLNLIQRRKRVAFCKKYLNWTADDWKSVMFSDESSITQFGVNTMFVRRPSGEHYNSRYQL